MHERVCNEHLPKQVRARGCESEAACDERTIKLSTSETLCCAVGVRELSSTEGEGGMTRGMGERW